MEYITGIFELIQNLAKSNPIVAGMISVYGLAAATWMLRSVPASIYDFVSRQITTTMTVNNDTDIYYTFLNWISKNQIHKFMRTYNLASANYWGVGNEFLTVGYGVTWFFVGKNLVFLNRFKIEAAGTAKSKETMTLTVLGRSSKIFYRIMDLIQQENDKITDEYSVFHWDAKWHRMAKMPKRSMDTIAIPTETKQYLLSHIDTFIADKQWYIDNGVPYRTGVLLQGPPGTGKTSLITAICSHYNKNLYILNLTTMTDTTLLMALSAVPSGDIVVIEDIDTHFTGRSLIGSSALSSADGKPLVTNGSTLGGVLNALDGIACGTDRVVFATTNHPERLDAALVREGRFNLKLTIGYMTTESLHSYFARLYPLLSVKELERWVIKPEIPPCKVQQLIFDNRHDPNFVLEQVAIREQDKLEFERIERCMIASSK